MDAKQIASKIEIYNSLTDSYLRTWTDKELEKDERLRDLVYYQLGWVDRALQATSKNDVLKLGGKKYRSTIFLFMIELSKLPLQSAVPLAAAIEYLQSYTLVIDDIQDNDPIRHGRDALWKAFGVPQSLNVASVLWALGLSATQNLIDNQISTSSVRAINDLYSKSCVQVFGGQFIDMELEQKFDVTLDEYLRMVKKKTSALFVLSLESAGLIANLAQHELDIVRQIGLDFGIAYSTLNDVSDIWGVEESSGKMLHADLQETKASLPLIYAYQKNKRLATTITVTRKSSQKEIFLNKVVKMIEETGAKEYSLSFAEDHLKKVQNGISRLPSQYLPLSDLFNYLLSNYTQHNRIVFNGGF